MDPDKWKRIVQCIKEDWSFHLANLESVLEGGGDLHHQHDTEHMTNYWGLTPRPRARW